jgi:hypothetical protein
MTTPTATPTADEQTKAANRRRQRRWTERHLGVDRTRVVATLVRSIVANADRQRDALGATRTAWIGAALLAMEGMGSREKAALVQKFQDLQGEPAKRKGNGS